MKPRDRRISEGKIVQIGQVFLLAGFFIFAE